MNMNGAPSGNKVKIKSQSVIVWTFPGQNLSETELDEDDTEGLMTARIKMEGKRLRVGKVCQLICSGWAERSVKAWIPQTQRDCTEDKTADITCVCVCARACYLFSTQFAILN